MPKPLILPRRLILASLLAGLPLSGLPADPDADPREKRPPHERLITQIESERLAFQRDLASREEACLKRFFSSRCLDKIRAEHLKRMREFDLRREAELQALRDIDAELRARNRSRRAEKKTESGS
ncbi:MAG: hypothetical protein ACKOCR_00665 [Burkholderiaceae bacterium]